MDLEQFKNIELEKEILGILLKFPKYLDKAMMAIGAVDFYHSNNKLLFSAIETLWSSSTKITIGTIYPLLKEVKEVGWISYVSDLESGAVSAEGLDKQMELLKTYTVRRKVRDINIKIAKGLENNKTSEEIISNIQESINNMQDVNKDDGNITNSIEEVTSNIEARYNNGGVITGISTGLEDLDRKINGLNGKEQIIIAARPGMGKSTLLNNILYNVASAKKKVILFNLEMSKAQIIEKLIANLGLVKASKLRVGSLDSEDWERYSSGLNKMHNVADSLMIFDDVFNLEQMVARVKAMHRQGKVDVLGIDYLQLVNTSKKVGSREQEVSYISRTLKQLGAELNITIIALSQLSRAPEMRADHRPMLSDLRESGSLEQDATTVMFCYRDEFYNKETEDRGLMEVIIGKQRAGENGTIRFAWLGQFQKVANLDYK